MKQFASKCSSTIFTTIVAFAVNWCFYHQVPANTSKWGDVREERGDHRGASESKQERGSVLEKIADILFIGLGTCSRKQTYVLALNSHHPETN